MESNNQQQIKDTINANSVQLFSLVNRKFVPLEPYEAVLHNENRAAAVTRLAIAKASKSI